MKKKTVILAAGLLIMTGCSQVAPELNGKIGKQNVSDATQVVGDTVSIDESKYGNSNISNSKFSKFNSSSDGFKSIYFNFDEYTISPEMETRIEQDAARAKEVGASRIKIEGNCDEFGTDEYNYALGLKRAKAVKDAMAAQGIDSRRMTLISYGESNPVCNEATDTCYARNRRTDLRLVK